MPYMNFGITYDFDPTYILTKTAFDGANARIHAHEDFLTASR
jgi:hypothetical protein